MKKKVIKPVLAESVKALAKTIINKTPDGDVGYSEASDTVSDVWDQFETAGANVGDLEGIQGYIRWAKFEGFCEAAPI